MPDLTDIMGAIAASVQYARQIADQNSISVALGYQQDPYLRTMPVPRFRLPEVVIDLPIVVDSFQPGQPEETAKPAEIGKTAREFLAKKSTEMGLSLSPAVLDTFSKNLTQRMTGSQKISPAVGLRENFAQSGIQLLRDIASTKGSPIPEEALAKISGELHDHIVNTSIIKPAVPPKLMVQVETDQVKGRGSTDTVLRLQFRLREEGLEWNEIKANDGTSKMKLSPE